MAAFLLATTFTACSSDDVVKTQLETPAVTEGSKTVSSLAFNWQPVAVQQPTEISSVAISTNVAKGDWVFDARNLSVETSDDGKTFKKIASEEYPEMKETDKDGIVEHKLTFAPVTIQYVRVIASPEKSLPAWHGGKGKNAFLFVDEIKID